jgi:hypothetical protein
MNVCVGVFGCIVVNDCLDFTNIKTPWCNIGSYQQFVFGFEGIDDRGPLELILISVQTCWNYAQLVREKIRKDVACVNMIDKNENFPSLEAGRYVFLQPKHLFRVLHKH